MTTKVNFELLKNQIVLDTLRKEIHCTLDEEEKQVLWKWINNYGLFLNTLAKSSTFAHLCHKELKKLTEPENPFDKLKVLWDNGNRMYIFEHWIYCHHMNFRFETYDELETPKQVHQWIAEHCGFNTIAEVRYAIQVLKEQ